MVTVFSEMDSDSFCTCNIGPHNLPFIGEWVKAANQKARSEQQDSAQPSNKRARIDFTTAATTSVAQRVSGTRSDANNPYLQHHSMATRGPTVPPRKSRFGTQYGAGSIGRIESGKRQWG
jgi:hypothetical protein